MYTDRDLLDTFPYEGTFFRTFVDESKPLDERKEERIDLLTIKCDIQGNRSGMGYFLNASFSIYIPWDVNDKLPFKRGDLFESNIFGMIVNGEIIGIYPSQLGGCSIYIKDMDV